MTDMVEPRIRIWFPVAVTGQLDLLSEGSAAAAAGHRYADAHGLSWGENAPDDNYRDFWLDAPLTAAARVLGELSAQGIVHGDVHVFGADRDAPDLTTLADLSEMNDFAVELLED
jgi:hypothetical protein